MAGDRPVSYDDELIRIIDERMSLYKMKTVSQGTCITRDTEGPGATVTFDGATSPVSVKVMGDCFCQPDDRVVAGKYGSDWLIIGSFSSTAFGEANRALDNLSVATGALTSSTFVDLTEFGTVQFDKTFDNTFVRMGLQAQAFVTGATAKPFWALRFTPIAGGIGYTPADIPFGGININQLSTHTSYTTFRRVTNIPAGSYTVSMRWRRVSGSGSVFADTNDSYAVELDENVRASVPIL